MIRLSQEQQLGHVFMGSQKDHKYVYSPKALQSGLIESNISNYRQVVQKVGYKSMDAQAAQKCFKPTTAPANVNGNFKKVDRIQQKTNEMTRSKNEMIEESGERGFPVRLYRRKPSTAKKVLNYFVQAHLQDK